MSEPTRGAPLKPLEDSSPLDGPSIDVGVRIGWLLRTARLTGSAPVPRLQDMVTGLGDLGLSTSSSSLHRLETGAVRDGRLVTGYEQLLGLVPGSLRAPIEIVCDTFPGSPHDRDVPSPVLSLATMTSLHDPVLDDRATGGDWLAWSQALGAPGNVGLPVAVAGEAIGRLASELARSVGTSYATRYAAMTRLRRSAYGGIVVDVVRRWVADPDVQLVNDVLSVVGERTTPDGLALAVELLRDERPAVVQGAAICLENMAQTGGDPAFWGPLLPVLAELHNAADPDGPVHPWTSHLLRLPTEEQQAQVRPLLSRAPAPGVPGPDPAVQQQTSALCQTHARRISQALGVPHQPVLGRLLFDTFAARASGRGLTSAFLLGALPQVAGPALEAIASIADEHPEPDVRGRASIRLTALVDDHLPDRVRAWAQPDHVLLESALFAAALAGKELPSSLVLPLMRRGARARHLITAVGIGARDLLEEIYDDPEVEEDVKAALRWCERLGPRVRDKDPAPTVR